MEGTIAITLKNDYYIRRGEWDDPSYNIIITRNVMGCDIIKINWKGHFIQYSSLILYQFPIKGEWKLIIKTKEE